MKPTVLSIAEQFPTRGIRFDKGRTEHYTRRPVGDRWFEDPLEAACGKIGYQARGYTNKPVRPCAACAKAVGEETEGALAA